VPKGGLSARSSPTSKLMSSTVSYLTWSARFTRRPSAPPGMPALGSHESDMRAHAGEHVRSGVMRSPRVILARTVIFGLVFGAMVAGGSEPALSACPYPVGPTVVSCDGVTRLNTYAEQSHVCIGQFDATNGCANCVSGFYHRCETGQWVKTYRQCAASQAARPDECSSDSSAQSQSGQPSGSQQLPIPGSPATRSGGSSTRPSTSGSGTTGTNAPCVYKDELSRRLGICDD
jgi:hypothetical protein